VRVSSPPPWRYLLPAHLFSWECSEQTKIRKKAVEGEPIRIRGENFVARVVGLFQHIILSPEKRQLTILDASSVFFRSCII
jgi:hypothetical protein